MESLCHNEQMNFFIFSHCFLSHFTSQYPQLACLSTQSLYSHKHICFLCHLLIFHTKHHLNLLSSMTKALLTHTLPSFWRKQSCHLLSFTSYDGRLSGYLFSFILERYMVCDVCGERSLTIQCSSVLFITILNNASSRELVLWKIILPM